MDITTDGFGFMLSFGDLVWVPFLYSLQARYLMANPVELSGAALAAIVAVFGVGYALFRGANLEKDAFRASDPAAAKAAGAWARARVLLCVARVRDSPHHSRVSPTTTTATTHVGGAATAGWTFLETKAGSRLLISGYWALSRHINYLGDWLMSLAQSLPTGELEGGCACLCVRSCACVCVCVRVCVTHCGLHDVCVLLTAACARLPVTQVSRCP
jgi:delta14-sterol reductase